MTRAHARSFVAMKVFVEQHQVPPVRIVVISRIVPMHWPPPLFILQEDARQPARQLGRHFPQRDVSPRSGRILYLEAVAKVVMKFLQRLDNEVVHRKPDWT